MTSQPTLKQAIEAYKAGRPTEARRVLEQILERDRANEGAWLWLSAVVDSDEQRAACLEQVLAVNASNAAARRGLERLRARGLRVPKSTEPAQRPEPAPVPPPSAPAVVPLSQAPKVQPKRSPWTSMLRVAGILVVGLAAAIVAYMVVASLDLSLEGFPRFTAGQTLTPTPIVWQPLSPQNGGFTISMPDEPESAVLPVDTSVGVIDLHMFTVEFGESAYIVGYSDYPESLVRNTNKDVMLDSVRDGAVANVGGSLVSERDIALQGYPGRELWVEAEASGQPGLVQARIYLVGTRLYQMLVAGSEKAFSESDAEYFLNSFQLR